MNTSLNEASEQLERCRSHTYDRHSPPPITKLEHVPELLAEIFTLCLPYGDVLPDARKPYNFIHVCRSWRAVALCTPLLWSRFTISGYNCDSTCEDRILHTWLHRSDRTPLTVRLCLYGRKTLGEVLWRCMVVLLMHANRWADIVVAMPWPFIRHILRRIGRRTPLLHTLTLIRTGAIIPGVFIKPLNTKIDAALQEPLDLVPTMPRHWKKAYGGNWRDCPASRNFDVSLPHKALPIKVKTSMSGTPALHRITLDGLIVIPILPHPGRLLMSNKLPQKFWDIRHLTLNYVCSTQALKILQASLPLLQSLRVSVARDVILRTHHIHKMQVNLPSLLHLDIQAHNSRESIPLILGMIRAPCLRKLSIGANKHSVDGQIGEFLRQSKPPLTHLHISGVTISQGDVINSLREVPSIQFFYIDTASVSDAILHALTLRTQSVVYGEQGLSSFEGLCSGLRRLELDVNAKFTGNSIVRLLTSRWITQGRVLEEAFFRRLSTSAATYVLEHPAINQCIEEGLRLFV